jgi:hypothetical protein
MGIELEHVGGIGENSVWEIGKAGGRQMGHSADGVLKQEGTVSGDIELTAI